MFNYIVRFIWFVVVSGIYGIIGRAIGLFITRFSNLGLIRNDIDFSTAFSSGVALGFIVGLSFMIVGARLFAFFLRGKPVEAMKNTVTGIVIAYLLAIFYVSNALNY